MISATNGHIELVKYFIEELGENVNQRMSDGWTPLMCCCKYNHSNIVKYLIKSGVNPMMSMVDGSFPLMLCAQNGHIELVKYFI